MVDTQTNTFGLLPHGHTEWVINVPGGVLIPNGLYQTAQLVMAKSTDDGKTWSKPINITEQVKEPFLVFLASGTGTGNNNE